MAADAGVGHAEPLFFSCALVASDDELAGIRAKGREGRGLLIFKKPSGGLRHAVSYQGRLIVDPREGRSYTSLWQLARAYNVRTTDIEVYHWDR